MPEFKNKEEYERWKAQKSKAAKTTADSVASEEKQNVDTGSQTISHKIMSRDELKPSNKRRTILFSIAGFIICITVASAFFALRPIKGLIGVGISSDLKKQTTDALKDLDDLKYGFKAGLNFNQFRAQKYEVQKRILSIEDHFSNSEKLDDLSKDVLSSFISSGIYLEIIECIWKDKIEKATLTGFYDRYFNVV